MMGLMEKILLCFRFSTPDPASSRLGPPLDATGGPLFDGAAGQPSPLPDGDTFPLQASLWRPFLLIQTLARAASWRPPTWYATPWLTSSPTLAFSGCNTLLPLLASPSSPVISPRPPPPPPPLSCQKLALLQPRHLLHTLGWYPIGCLTTTPNPSSLTGSTTTGPSCHSRPGSARRPPPFGQ
ncbi:hypothetical protein GOP47_0009866 [Adiantum capillus-veneris]|uniref:Uncharacterized protein n=1 Tax=Adiantum capillus-veneris TaxID=13818 RepID=A0A9D4ZK33_ADICA|nr:hypothetical protein GOP47_0009866 [Adiantum capillus-veneris]